MPLKIPPAIATPLIKGGRGDLNTIYSIQEVCCVSPELSKKGLGIENDPPPTAGE